MSVPNNRRYYSLRTGKNPNTTIPLETLNSLFNNLFKVLEGRNYFFDAFGGDDFSAFIPGYLGDDIDAQVFKALRKEHLWPIWNRYPYYSEDDLFDMIEFLFDHISKPIREVSGIDGLTVTYNKVEGQKEYRIEINALLADYRNGFELSPEGEILVIGEPGLTTLLEAQIKSYDPENIDKRVERARLKFRRAKSAVDERKDAIRELADVLEFMRDKAKKYMEEQDENDIFNIANNFDIRHHNAKQKTKYDNAIWYSWIFYYYLATIHALRLIVQKYEGDSSTKPES